MRKHLIKEHSRKGYAEKSSSEKSIPWREAFEEGIKQFTEVGLMLKGGRHKAGLTQKTLAHQIGVKPHHISEMEHGKRPIGKKMAQRLAKIFDVDYRIFL